MTFKFFLWKELKKYPLFFFLLFFTVFLGTIGLVGISFVSGKIQEKLQSSANELLTSDLSVSARRELTKEEKSIQDRILGQYHHDHYEVIDLYSMVSHESKKNSRLVEIRSTERGFPFYGEVNVREGVFDPDKLYVSQDLAEQWEIATGEVLKVGDLSMKISGIVVSDSSMGQRGFSLAPRIYFPLAKLPFTGLVRPGTTGNFSHHFKFQSSSEESTKEVKSLLQKSIKDSSVKVTLPRDSSDQTARVFNTLTNFMALSALVGLLLSLVGIFYLYQSHLHARLRDLSLLHLFGISKLGLASGIIFQFTMVFFFTSILELFLIIPLYRTFAPALSENLGLELGSSVSLMAMVKDLPLLYLLSVLILAPLIFGLLRTKMGAQLKSQKISLGQFRYYDFFPFAVSLWLFSSYLARSLRTGTLFFSSIALVFVLSTVLVRSGQWLLKKWIRGKRLSLPTIESGVALRGVVRSGHKLTLSFLSLAMGSALVSLILQLDWMILKEFSTVDKKPSLFIFDIQEEQLAPLLETAKDNGSPLEFVTPMIRARLEKLNGKKFVRKKRDLDFRAREEEGEDRLRNNGLNLTYRSYLTDAERIIDGEPFPVSSDEERLPYISIEKRWSERMGVSIGDRLTFDVQGVEFDGIVRNIKEVKWTSFYPNFFVTIEPGAIDAAPKTFLAIVPPMGKEKKLSLQRLSVEKFPNVSFIDVEEIVKKLSSLFTKSRKAIELMSWLSLTVGLIILYGLSHDQVYRRYYDLALLKTLGLSPWRLRLNLLHEFGSVFFSAMCLGLFLGWFIAQLIGREAFKLSFSIHWGRILGPAFLLTVLCLATILISSWRAVQSRPRELLSDT